MPDQFSDDVLFTQIQKGDSQALNLLFNKYYQVFCQFIFIIVQEKTIAEELSSNVFINLWKSRTKISIQSSLKAYLYKSAKNQAISYCRKRSELNHLFEGYSAVQDYEYVNPEASYIERELISEFDKALHNLPPRAQLAFRLHRFEGMRYSDIAEIMDISVSAVEKNIALALKSLHKELFQKTVTR